MTAPTYTCAIRTPTRRHWSKLFRFCKPMLGLPPSVPPSDTAADLHYLSPGNHTGVARYDTANNDPARCVIIYRPLLSQSATVLIGIMYTKGCATDFAAGVLTVPTGSRSNFALLSADELHSKPAAISRHRRSRCRRVRRHTKRKPHTSTVHIYIALRHALVRLDDDARMGQPCAECRRASAVLESPVLHIPKHEARLCVPGASCERQQHSTNA